MGAEDMTKQDLFNQLKDLIIATEDRLAARTDKTDARLDGIASDFNAWRPRLEGRVDALQSAVAALQRQAATNVPPAEVPTPANPTDEVLAPAISDSDAKLVTIDVGGPAAPAPTTAPTERMTTINIVPVLAAPAATDGTLHGQAVSGVLSTPATCVMVCLTRDPVAAPVLVASSTPAPAECVFDTNSTLVAAVPLSMTVEFPAVAAPTDSAPTVQLQQLYNDSEFFMLPTASQCITTKVAVHRPMPWPSFVGVHADGDEARPLPWPSFREINGFEFPSDVVTKASGLCISASAMVRSPELKLVPIGSVFITFLTVLVDSSNVPALTCAYFGVDSTVCIGSWLIAGWHQELYYSSFSCDTVCESILAPTIFSFVGANLICFSSAEVCALLVGLLRSGARIKSEMSKDAGTHATNVIIAVGISHSSTVRSRFGTGHAGLFQGFILMCWLQEQLLATWPAPIASCSVPKNMFLNAELSTLVICEFCGYMFRNVRSLELKCPKPEAFVNCATHDASYWPGNFVPVVQMQVPEQDRYLNMLADWLLQNQIILTRTSTARITEWILTQWDPGQEVVLSDFTKVSCSQAVHDTYLKKLMLQNLNVSDSNDSVSLGVLVCWSIGAGYLAWISYQEKKFSYVVVFKEYSEPKLRSEHQQKAIIGIGVASWSDLRVLIQFSWCTLNPWPPLRLMVCSHLLLLEHVSMGVELTHAGIILCLQNRRVNITKYIITTWFTYRILVHLAFATQLAVRSNCRQLDLGTQTAWYFGSSQSLTCEAYWKQFYEEFSQNLYSDQTFIMAHKQRPIAQSIYTDLLNCELFEESRCLVWISSDLHNSISLADSGCLGWGCQEAVSMKLDQDCHYIWSAHALQCFMTLKMELLNTNLVLSSCTCLLMDKRYQEGSYAMIPLIRGDNGVCNVALSAASQEVQLHIPWDPGGSVLLCLQLRLGVSQVVTENPIQVVTENLIKWSNGDEAAATWEDREELRGRFPEAPAWGQAGSQGGGGVRVPIVPDQQAQDEAANEALMDKQRPARPVKPNPKYYGPAWQR